MVFDFAVFFRFSPECLGFPLLISAFALLYITSCFRFGASGLWFVVPNFTKMRTLTCWCDSRLPLFFRFYRLKGSLVVSNDQLPTLAFST